jgi:hypothetical protein
LAKYSSVHTNEIRRLVYGGEEPRTIYEELTARPKLHEVS